MKKLRIIFTVLLFIGILLQSFVLAEEGYKTANLNDIISKEELAKYKSKENKTYQELFNEYNLKSISPEDVPEDVIVIKIDNVEDLQSYLNMNKSAIDNLNKDKDKNDNYKDTQTGTNNEISILTCTSGTSRRSDVGFNSISAKVTLYADIQTCYDGSFRWITGSNEWTTFSGVTLGMSWTEEYKYHTIGSNQTTITIKAGGTVTNYLWIEGILNIYSTPVNMEINYSVY